MSALVSRPREIFDAVPPPTHMRVPRGPFFPYYVAMHWDGTYRDRVIYTKDDPTYWDDEDKAAGIRPGPADLLAKHLAPNQIPDEPTPFDSGPY